MRSLFIVDNVLSLRQARHMLKQDRTIIHVEVKDTHEHFYFVRGLKSKEFAQDKVPNIPDQANIRG